MVTKEVVKKFKSKIGLELVVPLAIIFGIVLYLTLSGKPSWLGFSIIFMVILFVVHMFMTTYYIIIGNSLVIRCGFFFNRTIDITTVRKISETNNLLSSPATSLDRLEIVYGKFDSVIISPKQKKEFINDILLLNPDIEVILK